MSENKNSRLYCVYMHTNKLNNKKYIGITCRPVEVRWRDGKGYKLNRHFWSAIQKYGWDNFIHEILALNLSKEEAQKLEVELISVYNTTDKNFGYNVSIGGEGGARYSTEEEKLAARKVTVKKRYAKLKSDEIKYKKYLETNNMIHYESYHDPLKHDKKRARLNKNKQKYRQNPDFLKKDREATRKIKQEVKELRKQLLLLLSESPDSFSAEDIRIITERRASNGDFVCQSKLKLKKILEKFQSKNDCV